MSEKSYLDIDSWAVREIGLNEQTLAQTESLFALSNGHIGVRGNLDEGDPYGLPGTYLNSFFEARPLPYAEPGFGNPESGQTIVNAPNGKLIRLLVDDQPLDLRYGEVLLHERTLDLRRGLLRRHLEWRSPSGAKIRIRSTRLVSLQRRSLLAINYRVEPIDSSVRVALQSELVANEPLPGPSSDPRSATAMHDPLESVSHGSLSHQAHLVHRTHVSKLHVAVAIDHVIESGAETVAEMISQPDMARLSVGATLECGQALELSKFVGYGWSGTRSPLALRNQVEAAVVGARQSGWKTIVAEQEAHFEKFWAGADVEIDGAPEIQQAVRFAIFHTYQAAARAEQRAIPAKGLTGPGYDGHAFWDTEMFVLPLLTATAPDAAADALRWRVRTLELARERARALRLRGAAFPWRTINGEECSAYWPAGTAALHVNADIAAAAARHVRWTRDDEFERGCALPLLVETARLWISVGYDGLDGLFHIDGVTGPDEYTAVVDDNVYTNLMARQNLVAAALTARHWPNDAADLGVNVAETHHWSDVASRLAVPYDTELAVHQQDRGFTRRQVWDFERSDREGEYPLLLHVPYFELYPVQVVKQADLVLAMHWAGHEFTAEQKARNFAYYDELTVRDSSLSACTQAVLAAEVGHLELAAAYLAEASLMDLRDIEHNAGDGLHIASLAGSWLAVVAGFGGLRDHGEQLIFRPQLPPGWTRLAFAVRKEGCRLAVEITPSHVVYEADAPINIMHMSEGDEPELVHLSPGRPIQRRWTPVIVTAPALGQPAGRAVMSTGHTARFAEPREQGSTANASVETDLGHTKPLDVGAPRRGYLLPAEVYA